MALSTSLVWFLVVGMLVTGTANTILNKLQDLQCVENCDDPDPKQRRYFEQPVWQTLNMFVGEACCLLVYYAGILYEHSKSYRGYHGIDAQPASALADEDDIHPHGVSADSDAEINANENIVSKSSSLQSLTEPLSGSKNLLMWIPTVMDMTATTLMNVGLIYISASIYQMIRGSVVIFTGILSYFFLERKHPPYRWFALVMVFFGVGLVGLSSIVGSSGGEANHLKTNPIGVLLVLLAQMGTASQYVIEEKILGRYDVPAIKVVGLEGIFGLLSLGILVPILYYTAGIHGEPGNYFDVPAGLSQIIRYPQIFYPGVGIIFSIAFFNYFGLSITRVISATSRSTIDTSRTLFIWIISLSLGWETFKWLQVAGFLVMIYGTFLFNDVISPPPLSIFKKPYTSEEEVVHVHQTRDHSE